MHMFVVQRTLCLALLFGMTQIALAQPTISGIVRNASNGNPLSGADLDVFDANGKNVSVTGDASLADGSYTINLPGPGDYIIRVDLATGSPLVDQYYNSVFFKSEATPVNVPTDASQISGINFSLPGGYAIAGRVTGNGVAQGNIDLDLYGGNGEFIGNYPAQTASDGTFTIGALPNGTYYLKADPDPALGQYFIFRYFGGTEDISGATPIVVNGSSVTGINWDLPVGGAISGIIQSDTGTPLADIDLDIYDLNGNRLPYNARSGQDGTYAIGPLPAGSYLLSADPSVDQGYIRTFYGNGLDLDLASPIAVSQNQTSGGIDFSLKVGGSISGKITTADGSMPVAGIDLDIFDAETGTRVDLTAKSDANGNYVIGVLPVGSYFVRADPEIGSGYSGNYYGGSGAQSTAQPIIVTLAQDTPNISFQLQPGGWISGIIQDAFGNPLEGIDLDAFDSNLMRLYPTARSGLNGNYTIGPFPPGGIILRADPQATSGFGHVYHPDAGAASAAIPVAVEPETGTSGIDFSLPQAGWITGTIRNLSGVPIAGIDVDIFDDAGNRISLNAVSALDGTYQLGPVPVGAVVIRADPGAQDGFAHRYFPDSPDSSTAGLVTVTAGLETPSIDFSLPPAGWISGFVLDTSGQPVAGIDLDLFNASTGARISGGTASAADGSYVLGPLEFNSYHLRADPEAMDGFARRYFPNARSDASAGALSVNTTTGLTGIDFILPPAGYISGVVTDSNSQTISGIDLDLYDAVSGARVSGGGSTALDGTYILGPLEFGSYIVRADPDPGQPYVRAYFQDADRLNNASPISVAGGVTGISFNLVTGNYLSGQVLLPDGQPASGIDMDIIDANSGLRLEQTAITDAGGFFVLPPVPLGTYLLRADPVDSEPYLDTYYIGTEFPAEAARIDLTASGDFSGLGIQLQAYTPPSISRTDSSDSFIIFDGSGRTADYSVSTGSGDVVELGFYLGNTLVSTDASPPFTLTADTLPHGMYHLVPVALDVFGRETEGPPLYVIFPELLPDINNPLFLYLPDGTRRILLSWKSVPGMTYTVYTASHPGGPWSTLAPAQVGTGDIMTESMSFPGLIPSTYLYIEEKN